MKQVEIYIIHTAKQKRVPNAVFAYCIAYRGSPCRYGMGELQDTTPNSLSLSAMVDALRRMKEPCSIHIYLNADNYIANMVSRRTPWTWRNCGWRNSKGQTVADWPKWEQLVDLMDRHDVKVTSSKQHRYTEHLWAYLRGDTQPGKL